MTARIDWLRNPPQPSPEEIHDFTHSAPSENPAPVIADALLQAALFSAVIATAIWGLPLLIKSIALLIQYGGTAMRGVL